MCVMWLCHYVNTCMYIYIYTHHHVASWRYHFSWKLQNSDFFTSQHNQAPGQIPRSQLQPVWVPNLQPFASPFACRDIRGTPPAKGYTTANTRTNDDKWSSFNPWRYDCGKRDLSSGNLIYIYIYYIYIYETHWYAACISLKVPSEVRLQNSSLLEYFIRSARQRENNSFKILQSFRRFGSLCAKYVSFRNSTTFEAYLVIWPPIQSQLSKSKQAYITFFDSPKTWF